MNGTHSTFTACVGTYINELLLALHKSRNTRVSLMLTGGRSASSLYQYCSGLFNHSKISYYFGDERCVQSDHSESNYCMAINTLFPNGMPDNCQIEKIRGDSVDYDAEADRYAKLLPAKLDILLLSVGPDGHIASLFPRSSSLNENVKKVLSVRGSKLPVERVTITPKVIEEAKNIIVMATGEEKGCVLAAALNNAEDTQELPVRLTIGSTWILDESASQGFNSSLNQYEYRNTSVIHC
ncbi:hypothetical protein MNBD_GAMMA12-1332 [hydrothermal vent metagenome]|uniref:Glucosamine/galactosamine-6-phosphate isomerase domain-containing protein n=1 Tax=hydrothermal vent metagenome TaxID=652676 RepID=A0A3B0Y768_9ZZZZ